MLQSIYRRNREIYTRKNQEGYTLLAGSQTSTVSEHDSKTGHHPFWNKIKFIDGDSHWDTRRIKEAIHIGLHPNKIKRDNGRYQRSIKKTGEQFLPEAARI